MSVMPYATVVGVFRDKSAADLAMQALTNAGFKREQMRCLVANAAGGFLDSLKSVFSGLSPEEETLVSNLTDMGLSSDEARYFSDEYAQGSAILAIKTQGDEEMALNILYEYGAHNAKERARFGGVMASPNRPVSSEGSNAYAAPVSGAVLPDPVPPSQPTYTTQGYQQNEAAANASVDVPSPQTQPPLFDFTPLAYSVETTPRASTILSPEEISDNRTEPFPQEVVNNPDTPLPQEDANTLNTPLLREDSSAPDAPFSQSDASSSDAPLPQEAEQTTADQVDEVVPEQEETDSIEEMVTPAYSDEQISLINPDSIEVVEIDEVAGDETPLDQTNADVYPQISTGTDTELLDQTNADAPTLQANGNDISTRADELQQLLAQIETTKQQLAEARSQLEEAKQHESRLTTARLQLKELQAELQATQAELQQIQQRATG